MINILTFFWNPSLTQAFWQVRYLVLLGVCGLHIIRHGPVFTNVCRNGKYQEKSSLNSSKNRLLLRTHFAKSFSQNAHESDESLSKHYSHFARILFVRSFSSLHTIRRYA